MTPTLRAKGITRESDRLHFSLARERCRAAGIELVPLPCPESLYLGRDRVPGTFLERLNTSEFTRLLDTLESDVRALIKERGPPLFLLGVDSSPTCGVTRTYYGGTPPRIPGRGVFFSRFPEIHALDVVSFATHPFSSPRSDKAA